MNAAKRKRIDELVKQLLLISAKVEGLHINEKDDDARSFLESAESDIDRAIRYLQQSTGKEPS
jgi:hypothetical protein